jgi:hypothetical protein
MRVLYLFPHTDDESFGPGSGASPPSAQPYRSEARVEASHALVSCA